MQDYNDEIKLKDILIKFSEYKSYLFSKKFWIITISVFFFVLGLIFSLIYDKKYTAGLTFVIEEQSETLGSLGNMSGVANQFGFDIGGSSNTTFSQNNILEFLKLRVVFE